MMLHVRTACLQPRARTSDASERICLAVLTSAYMPLPHCCRAAAAPRARRARVLPCNKKKPLGGSIPGGRKPRRSRQRLQFKIHSGHGGHGYLNMEVTACNGPDTRPSLWWMHPLHFQASKASWARRLQQRRDDEAEHSPALPLAATPPSPLHTPQEKLAQKAHAAISLNRRCT